MADRRDSLDNSDPVVREYAKTARDYDKKWAFYIDATTRETIRRLPIAATERVLDVGCGTGALLHRLAAMYPGARLAGMDPVPEMLEMAKAKLPAKADLQSGWANQLPWPDQYFDVVVSCNMFHYVTHPEDALNEMGRVLRPGGTLVITDWCDDYLACQLCNIYLRVTSRAFFKTYRAGECLTLLRAAGHADAHVERYKINWIWGLMTASATKAVHP